MGPPSSCQIPHDSTYVDENLIWRQMSIACGGIQFLFAPPCVPSKSRDDKSRGVWTGVEAASNFPSSTRKYWFSDENVRKLWSFFLHQIGNDNFSCVFIQTPLWWVNVVSPREDLGFWSRGPVLGPVLTGRGAPCNMRMQIMEHTAVNGSVPTGCKQHQSVWMQICGQICLCVLCEWGPRSRIWDTEALRAQFFMDFRLSFSFGMVCSLSSPIVFPFCANFNVLTFFGGENACGNPKESGSNRKKTCRLADFLRNSISNYVFHCLCKVWVLHGAPPYIRLGRPRLDP